MTVIMCADKNGAVMFNKRRCSQDQAVIADILAAFPGQPICISAYSAPLFAEAAVKIIDSPEALQAQDVVFLEDIPFTQIAEKCDTLIVYRWDRAYPGDVKLVIDGSFTLVSAEEFAGFSHEKITKEVYKK